MYKRQIGNYRNSLVSSILPQYNEVPGFSSMLLEDYDHLFEHISKIHELSYSHYLWAKGVNLRGTFPRNCCNVSSNNVLLSLLDYGYVNATKIVDYSIGHCYNMFPFQLKDSNIKGFVILDPTSEQTFVNKTTSPRNYISVISGNNSSCRFNTGLFPISGTSTFSNLATLRKSSSGSFTNIDLYLKEVFKNSLVIKNNSN